MNQSACRISFEFFPPKSPEGQEKLLQVANRLSEFMPSFFSVTFGAGGSTRQRTPEAVNDLHVATSVPIAPHVSCLGLAREELHAMLNHYQEQGVKRLVVLRGDLPVGAVSAGEFQLACDFVAFIRNVTGSHFQIEVAAYPEFHPQAASVMQDVINLKMKFDAGANTAITQYFFNTDAFFYYRDACEKHQIDMPIVPGIMPIMHVDKLMRFSEICGAEVPRWLVKRLQAYGDDVESVRAFGVESSLPCASGCWMAACQDCIFIH